MEFVCDRPGRTRRTIGSRGGERPRGTEGAAGAIERIARAARARLGAPIVVVLVGVVTGFAGRIYHPIPAGRGDAGCAAKSGI